MDITLTLLGSGTSQGVPIIGCACVVCSSTDSRDKRLRTSAMLEIKRGDRQTRIIIDAGPDFRYQMLRENVQSVDAILITHEHKDHIGGIDDIRAFNYLQSSAIRIYCQQRVAQTIKKDFSYAFVSPENRYAGVPEIDLQIIDQEPFYIDGIEIVPIRVMHQRLPILGYRIGGVVYITDASYIPEESMAKMMGCELLVINALRHQKHPSHFTLDEAIEVSRLVAPKETIITHISHQMGLYRQVEARLPEEVKLGYDSLKIFTIFVK